jgi:acetolactate synthase-1/2/3 large subunit
MGFGLGAAMGAKLGNPDKCVVHITGDGSFRMNCNELATVSYYNIPIITIIFNNGCLGMVRQWQTVLYDKHYSQTTLDRAPDFVRLAQAYGIEGCRVVNTAELSDALKYAYEKNIPFVIDARIAMDEMVKPMVSAGSKITDFIVS